MEGGGPNRYSCRQLPLLKVALWANPNAKVAQRAAYVISFDQRPQPRPHRDEFTIEAARVMCGTGTGESRNKVPTTAGSCVCTQQNTVHASFVSWCASPPTLIILQPFSPPPYACDLHLLNICTTVCIPSLCNCTHICTTVRSPRVTVPAYLLGVGT